MDRRRHARKTRRHPEREGFLGGTPLAREGVSPGTDGRGCSPACRNEQGASTVADRGGFRHQVEQLVTDTRYFFRRSRRVGAFTITAVAVIALGMAANVAVFSIAGAVLLRPPAFP